MAQHLDQALSLKIPEDPVKGRAIRHVPQSPAQVSLLEFLSDRRQSRLDLRAELPRLPLLPGRRSHGRLGRDGLGRGGRARRSLLVRLQPQAVERLDLRPVSLLEHLHAGAELVVELPPAPLVLGLIQEISSTSVRWPEDSTRELLRSRTRLSVQKVGRQADPQEERHEDLAASDSPPRPVARAPGDGEPRPPPAPPRRPGW